MIFKGERWQRTRRVVTIPDSGNYVVFGRTCARDTKGAIRTNYNWRDRSIYDDPEEDGKYPVYALPIKPKGYSLTNLMYGADGYKYLQLDGRIYVRKSSGSGAER